MSPFKTAEGKWEGFWVILFLNCIFVVKPYIQVLNGLKLKPETLMWKKILFCSDACRFLCVK